MNICWLNIWWLCDRSDGDLNQIPPHSDFPARPISCLCIFFLFPQTWDLVFQPWDLGFRLWQFKKEQKRRVSAYHPYVHLQTKKKITWWYPGPSVCRTTLTTFRDTEVVGCFIDWDSGWGLTSRHPFGCSVSLLCMWVTACLRLLVSLCVCVCLCACGCVCMFTKTTDLD